MDAINGNNATDSGFLQVSVVAGDTMKPLQDARVSISYSGEPETDIEQLWKGGRIIYIPLCIYFNRLKTIR